MLLPITNLKISISIGILSWKSHSTLINTLESYRNSGLLGMVSDVTIFFQEGSERDASIADHYNVNRILSPTNVGIGKAFADLAKNAKTDYILFLENDWVNIEKGDQVFRELMKGKYLIDNYDVNVVKYRHRENPGDPLYTRQFAGREQDSWKHLMDCVHWTENPDESFPDKIIKNKDTDCYITSSKYANFTNNPTLYKKQFYIDVVSPFAGDGIDLEGKIQDWWEEQPFTVAHGNGLFTHKRIDR